MKMSSNAFNDQLIEYRFDSSAGISILFKKLQKVQNLYSKFQERKKRMLYFSKNINNNDNFVSYDRNFEI